MDRICIKCGSTMEPVKNGFFFTISGYSGSSDLWGCKLCNRFQIHGSPGATIPTAVVYKGVVVEDPGNPEFKAILDPEFDFPPGFDDHMQKWYPHWNWKGGKK